jgi:hypothetical protein
MGSRNMVGVVLSEIEVFIQREASRAFGGV